jgi:dTDP-4-dehydrorhamnose 3,5-epimerase
MILHKSLKLVNNERGSLLEVLRCDDENFPGFGQAYITTTFAGVIKAWYRHKDQIDQITVIKGKMLLVLYDTRPKSPSYGEIREITISEEAPGLVQIPPGVWHGFKALGRSPLHLLHLNSAAYRHGDVDEERLDPFDKGIPYAWPDS